MKLHYQGKYDLNEESLPHLEHQENAVPFREAKDSKSLSLIANVVCILLMILFAIPLYLFYRNGIKYTDFLIGCGLSLITMFPHELLHAICFKEDVYLYTNLKQGMLFVIGPEIMSKSRFIFMSLLPNCIFGFLPYFFGMMDSNHSYLSILGVFAIGMGAGDYYNVFNAIHQMPKGAKTYLYQFHSYWFLPKK